MQAENAGGGALAIRDQLRARVLDIEAQMLELPQLELLTIHHFAPGIYARELHIPAGTTLTGAIHKFENMNILSAGDITVVTESGPVRLQAPCTIVSPPGTKRIAFAHTDTVWITLFGTDERDPEKIIAQFTTRSDQDYLAFRESLELEGE
jgi:hypothetical protein